MTEVRGATEDATDARSSTGRDTEVRGATERASQVQYTFSEKKSLRTTARTLTEWHFAL